VGPDLVVKMCFGSNAKNALAVAIVELVFSGLGKLVTSIFLLVDSEEILVAADQKAAVQAFSITLGGAIASLGLDIICIIAIKKEQVGWCKVWLVVTGLNTVGFGIVALLVSLSIFGVGFYSIAVVITCILSFWFMTIIKRFIDEVEAKDGRGTSWAGLTFSI